MERGLKENEKELEKGGKEGGEVMEGEEKDDVGGKKENVKKGVGKMGMDRLRDEGEKSSVGLGDVDVDKMGFLGGERVEVDKGLGDMKRMKVNLN